ncbi:TfoX/Sxy family protein [Dokdonella sp.]|uniref:TfoX/Sxy family protein n=1 Tax=Dokdonella sp. TaxID=2291710 RepID=UPI003527311E
MAIDDGLAERIREQLEPRHGITEKRMFGGLAFLADGHMFIGLARDALMVRVGPDDYETALARPHVRLMDFTGKPMRGYVFVDQAGLEEDGALNDWIQRSLAFVRSLPPKR